MSYSAPFLPTKKKVVSVETVRKLCGIGRSIASGRTLGVVCVSTRGYGNFAPYSRPIHPPEYLLPAVVDVVASEFKKISSERGSDNNVAPTVIQEVRYKVTLGQCVAIREVKERLA